MTRQFVSILSHILILLPFISLGLACTDSDGSNVLRDGLYPVLWEATTPDSATLGISQHVVLSYDRKYTGSTQSDPRTYLAIDTTSSVPLILEGQPEALRDGSDRALLSVTLAREYAEALEEFTTEHLGEGVAILIDGEVVTMHKLRSIIRGGKLQITRCDENSCEVLRAKLMN